MSWKLLGFVALCFLTGCAASGAQFEPVANRNGAVIYVYAPGELAGLGEQVTILVDDAPAGKVVAGGFIAVDVEPGRHSVERLTGRIFKRPAGRKRIVDLAAGDEAYFRLRSVFSGITYAPGSAVIEPRTAVAGYANVLERVPNRFAAKEIQSTRRRK